MPLWIWISLLASLASALTIVDPPGSSLNLSDGIFTSSLGPVNFVQGEVVLRIEINHDPFIQNSLIMSYKQSHRLMQFLREVSYKLTVTQKTQIMVSMNNFVTYLGQCLRHTPHSFLVNQFNATRIDDIKTAWDTELTHVLFQRHAFRPSNLTQRDVTPNLSSPNLSSFTPRSRRGLIDIGGSFLNTVFGVATEKQFFALDDTVKNMSIDYVNSLHLMSTKTSALQDNIKANLKRLDIRLSELQKRFLQDKYETSTFPDVRFTAEHLSNTLMHIAHFQAEFNTERSLLKTGIVPHIFSDVELETIIAYGHRQFSHLRFPLSLADRNADVSSVYHLLKCTRVIKQQYFIIFPFVSQKLV